METNLIQVTLLLFTLISLYNLIFYIFVFFYFKKMIIKNLKKTINELKKLYTN